MYDLSKDGHQYLNFIKAKESPHLEELRKVAEANYVPIIRHEMADLLRVLIGIKRPLYTLEIGTAIGYSSLLIAEVLEKVCPANYKIRTIERNRDRYEQACVNIGTSSFSQHIEVIKGDADVILKDIKDKNGKFDLIFMDAAKGQYPNFLEYTIDLLAEDGLLISDNVLQEGEIYKSRYAIPRRQRTIHKRMRDYLWKLNHDPRLRTSILNVGDGVTLSQRL